MLSDKKIVTIYSGTYYVSDDPQVVIHTLLGSCIAVCLFDNENHIGGMNHFLLPEENPARKRLFKPDSGWFGLDSMEAMIGRVLELGGVFSNLKAKVFGGGQVVDNLTPFNINLAEANIKFILSYLSEKKIPVIVKDVGGRYGRKVLYYLEDHSVLVQRLEKELKLDV
ncbi:MAG: chemotaxis protein CheD [Firmicutes bacterium]|nr:chemotaxis protein CheD [Bacillota bacterium]